MNSISKLRKRNISVEQSNSCNTLVPRTLNSTTTSIDIKEEEEKDSFSKKKKKKKKNSF